MVCPAPYHDSPRNHACRSKTRVWLCMATTGREGTENPRVGGSIPSLGTGFAGEFARSARLIRLPFLPVLRVSTTNVLQSSADSMFSHNPTACCAPTNISLWSPFSRPRKHKIASSDAFRRRTGRSARRTRHFGPDHSQQPSLLSNHRRFCGRRTTARTTAVNLLRHRDRQFSQIGVEIAEQRVYEYPPSRAVRTSNVVSSMFAGRGSAKR